MTGRLLLMCLLIAVLQPESSRQTQARGEAGGIERQGPEGRPRVSEDGVRTPITVEDAIRMVRIQDRYGTDRRFIAFSPDGSRFAVVVWRGDLERNMNLYSLLVFDVEDALARPRTNPAPVLTIPFPGDSLDQAATPIVQLSFLADNRTVTFLGTLEGEPRQVYAVDAMNGEVRALTRHPGAVHGYAVDEDGTVLFYAAAVSDAADSARIERLRTDGASPYDAEAFPEVRPLTVAATVFLTRLRGGGALRYFEPAERPGGEPKLIADPRAVRLRAPSVREHAVPDDWSPVHAGFNSRRPVVSNGRMVVGVTDSPTMPPELAAHDLVTGETIVLTDLNPELRGRRYGAVEQIRFSTRFDSVSTGWLVRPVDYAPGRRYPLVVLLANERERPDDRSYLIDGRHNLSGHAAQPLAAHGFMVLFIGEPPSGRPGTLTEIEVNRTNIEEAIRSLARKGYVDTLRVGVSGWSRSAWYTDQLLMRSDFPFAAASQIDGGGVAYDAGDRPYTDDELARIRTPLLMQAHGFIAYQFVFQGAMADRLRAMRKPVDILYFPTASHSTTRPRHRWQSLTTHVDWWRFWLQDYEDPDPEKQARYERWRGLRRNTLGTIPRAVRSARATHWRHSEW